MPDLLEYRVPISATLLVLSLPYVAASWRVLEGSPEVGGIPGIFVLKTGLPVMAVLLLAAGLADGWRALRTLRDPGAHG